MEIRGLGYFEGNSAVLTPPIGVAAKFRETTATGALSSAGDNGI